MPRRVPLLPLAGLAIVLIAAVGAILISVSMAAANRAVSHSIEVRVGLSELGHQLAAQNAGFRGYLLMARPAQAEEESRARIGAMHQLGRLNELLSDEPTQQADLRILGPLILARQEDVRVHMAERAHGGTGIVRTEAERSVLQRTIAGIEQALARMSEEEHRLLAQRAARAQRLISWLSIALVGAVLLVVVVAYLIVEDARARVRALHAATRATQAEAAARMEAEEQLRQIQKMESIGQLTGGIAHDFNNMLAVVVGNLDLARRRIEQPEKAARHISDALEGAGRATTLVSRMLAFSRRQPLAPVGIAINDFLADLAEPLRRMLGEHIVIETCLADDAWPSFADRVQLENAVLNLAVNARDAMESGGTLLLASRNMTVDDGDAAAAAGLVAGDYIELEVADTGAGMSADVIARAFDPFFTTKTVGRGTGLGLSQVFGFVRQSGGHVTIDSELGRGTRVRMLLPRFVGVVEEATPVSDDAADPIAPTSRRILLVEDDERVRRFSVDALRELGYEPMPAAGGAEALRLLAEDPDIAVLFTDVVMPGMSGPELADTVRALRPGMPVLFTTGYARDGVDASATADLDAPVLAKPFSVGDLGAKLSEVLAG